MENDVILEINGLSKNFGKVEALNDVSVTLKPQAWRNPLYMR